MVILGKEAAEIVNAMLFSHLSTNAAISLSEILPVTIASFSQWRSRDHCTPSFPQFSLQYLFPFLWRGYFRENLVSAPLLDDVRPKLFAVLEVHELIITSVFIVILFVHAFKADLALLVARIMNRLVSRSRIGHLSLVGSGGRGRKERRRCARAKNFFFGSQEFLQIQMALTSQQNSHRKVINIDAASSNANASLSRHVS